MQSKSSKKEQNIRFKIKSAPFDVSAALKPHTADTDLLALHPRLVSALEQFFSAPKLYDSLLIELGGAETKDAFDYLVWLLKKTKWSCFAEAINLDEASELQQHCSYQKMLKKNFSYDALLKPSPRLFYSLSQCEYEWIGHIYEDPEGPFLAFGRLHLAHGGCLMLPIRTLLREKNITKALYHLLSSGVERWGTLMELHGQKGLPSLYFPALPIRLKVLLVGHHDEIEQFKHENPYWGKTLYSLLEPNFYAPKTAERAIWLRHLYRYCLDQNPNLEPFSQEVSEYLLWQGGRICGSQKRLPMMLGDLAPLKAALEEPYQKDEVNKSASKVRLSLRKVKQKFRGWEFTKNFWKILLQREFLEGALSLNFSGKKIGQIHGLAFVDEPLRTEYAVVFRLSCVKYPTASDPEFLDLDAKFGLGGNSYQKGNAIFYSYLRSYFKMPAHFPFAFSFVAEQTYEPFDGDSGTLAGFCCLLSTLLELPICQNVAVTGSMDQFGQVQAIGKVSEKIEGFFDLISKTKAFREKSAVFKVLIPKANLQALLLSSHVQCAIQEGRFDICPVGDVKEAIPHFFEQSYASIQEKTESVFKEKEESKEELAPTSWCARFLKMFKG